MREHLLGFVLGALDHEESRAVQEAIERDPSLKDDVERIEAHLALLHHDRQAEPPPAGLARRTCEFVYSEHDRLTLASGAYQTNMAGGEGHRMRWGLADLVVALGICAAAALLFFPAIANSRWQAQLAVCQNNLREIGQAAFDFEQLHGTFPAVPVAGNLSAAGIYGPVLREGGFLARERALVCPGSSWASSEAEFRVPRIAELEQAREQTLAHLRQMMGGSYAYTLGYVSEGEYRPVRNLSRTHYALLADAPNTALPERRSGQHGGKGQNVLFENGTVKYLVECSVGDCLDKVFVSDRGLVEPGRHADDAVLGASNEPLRLSDQ